MNIDLSIFKDYDIRGVYPQQINGNVFSEIAHAIVRKFQPESVAICRDMRLSGQEIRDAMIHEFVELGINVFDAGLTGTEMQYYIAGTKDYDLVIMISASHNPPQNNGIKLVLKGPISISGEGGLYDIRDLLIKGKLPYSQKKGSVTVIDVFEEWKNKLWSIVETKNFKPLKVVIDAGNGMGGVLATKALENTVINIIPLYFEPDGHFPNHLPNPLITTNNQTLSKTIIESQADIGVTFDGDADRMFLLDDKGRFISGTITTALLAKYILINHPGELILYNAICGRIVPETIQKFNGKSMRVRVGHSLIKRAMKETGAIFAGEHSGHYYHRDFFKAETGIGTAMMIFMLLSKENRKLSQLIDEFDKYPSSGEINFKVNNAKNIQECIKQNYQNAQSIDEIDGISVWYQDYWFNVRASNTEPLLRLNVEADNLIILKTKTEELINFIHTKGGIKQ